MHYQDIILLTLLFTKHFIADFLLQSEAMATQKGKNVWILCSHSGQHAALTLLILLFFTSPLPATAIAVAEFIIHSGIDYLKSNTRFFGRFKPPSREFFILFGVDQYLHALTFVAVLAAVPLL
ncbi:MAG: DUF3307 domain-containing protein [Patescibacteria group bacterium]|nr:DUF3307 domain-containing protein [Patescibacteria group bacterium]